MKDIFTRDDIEFLKKEAEIVKDWPDVFQSLLDKKLISVEYDLDNNPIFYLTELGYRVCNEIDLKLN